MASGIGSGTPASLDKNSASGIPTQAAIHSIISPSHAETSSNILRSPDISINANSTAIPSTEIPGSVITPTVAETGVPISAGEKGPGPITGSLARDNTASSSVPVPEYSIEAGEFGKVPQQHESAEDEKKRLQREERERLLNAPVQGEDAPSYTAGDYGDQQYGNDKKGKGPEGPSGTPPPYS